MRTHFRLALAVVALSALPAQATTTYYASGTALDESTFNADLTGLGLSVSLSDFATYNGFGPSTTLSDVFSTGIDFLGLDTSNGARELTVASGVLSLENTTGMFLKMTTAAPGDIVAVGFHFTWTAAAGGGYFCLDLQEAYAPCVPRIVILGGSPTTQFFGIISDDGPLSSSLIFGASSNGQGPKILNFGVAAVEQTPEPRTLLLLGTGLLMVGLRWRRQGGRRE